MKMKSFYKLAKIKIKLFLREPPALFFTLFFAPMILVIFGEIYGNKPNPAFGGMGTVDISVPAYIAIIIAGVGLISLPIATASSRERGELRRLQVTPLRPLVYMGADILVYFIMALCGVLLLVLTGEFVYHARFSGRFLSVLFGFSLATVSFFSFGFLIAAVSKTGRIAQSIGMFLCFPMMFLSGAGMPLELMPQNIKTASNFIPLKHVVTLMRGLWAGDPLFQHINEIIILTVLLVVCGFISTFIFKWE